MIYAIDSETQELVKAKPSLNKNHDYNCPICGCRVYLRKGPKGRCYFAHARIKGSEPRRCHAKDKDILDQIIEELNALKREKQVAPEKVYQGTEAVDATLESQAAY